MIKTLDKCTSLGPAGNSWVSCCLQDQFGMLKRIPLTKVPQEIH